MPKEHASHDHRFLDQRGDARVQPKRKRNIGQWTDKHQSDLMRMPPNRIDDGHRGRHVLVFAVPNGMIRLPEQRPVSSLIDRHIIPYLVQQPMRQPGRAVYIGIAIYGGHRQKIDIGIRYREGECETVIHISAKVSHGQIGIQDYLRH